MTEEIHDAELLCKGSELQLYLESCDPWIQESAAERVRQCKRRALRLALMWHAEVNSGCKDTRVLRGKTQAQRAGGSVMARRKAELFDQIAERLTSRLGALDKASHEGVGYPAAMGADYPPPNRRAVATAGGAVTPPPKSVRMSRRWVVTVPEQPASAQQPEAAVEASGDSRAD
jgi:hypothetical protein